MAQRILSILVALPFLLMLSGCYVNSLATKANQIALDSIVGTYRTPVEYTAADIPKGSFIQINKIQEGEYRAKLTSIVGDSHKDFRFRTLKIGGSTYIEGFSPELSSNLHTLWAMEIVGESLKISSPGKEGAECQASSEILELNSQTNAAGVYQAEPNRMIDSLEKYGTKCFSKEQLMLTHIATSAPALNANYKVPERTPEHGKKGVIELFTYACPHCYDTEKNLNDWLTRKPDDVSFTRLPAAWNDITLLYAKAYHIAESLNILDKSHEAIFELIHTQKKGIHNDEQLKSFFLSIGVTAKQYDAIYNSFALAKRVEKSQNFAKEYGISSVPAFVINDKFVTVYRTHQWPSRTPSEQVYADSLISKYERDMKEYEKSPSSNTMPRKPTRPPASNFELLEWMLYQLPHTTP